MSVDELLQQEVVSVSRRPEAWATAASNVFYINGTSATTTGATSLPDVLRVATNLFVGQSSSYHWGVESRGFMRTNAHSNKLLVLVDGRTAYSPLFSNVFWDSTDVFLPDLHSIEVISGPSGANWGSNAVNGVINITSKSAHETVGGLMQVSAGFEDSQVAIRQGVKWGKTGAMRVYAKRTDRDATLSPTGTEDGNDGWYSNQVGFRTDWGTATTGEFTVQGDALMGRYDNNPQAQIRNDAGNLLMRWSRDLDAGSQVWVRGYYDYVMRDSSGFLKETTHTFDLEFQHHLDLTADQQLLWGGNFRRINDIAADPVGFAILPEDVWFNVVSAFAQHEVKITDRWRLTTGARIEHNHVSGWEFQPTLRLAWRGENQTAWASASRASRVPSRLETGFHAPATPPYFIAGGPDFRAETLTAYELGWRGQPVKNLALTATVYYHDYDHLRTVELTSPIVQANGGEGRSYGTEVFLDYDVTAAWRFRAGGFLMRQENWLKPGSTDTERGRGEANFPEHQFYLRNTFRLTATTDLWLSLRTIADVPALENGGGHVPAYTELDACFRWRFRPNFELSLVGRNLLDRSHPELGGVALRREVQRNGYVTFRYEY